MNTSLPDIAKDVMLAWGSWELPPEPILDLYRRGLVDGDPYYAEIVEAMHDVTSYVDFLLLVFAEPFVFSRLVGSAIFQLALATEGKLLEVLKIPYDSADFDYAQEYLEYCLAAPWDERIKVEGERVRWARSQYRYLSEEQFSVSVCVLNHCLTRVTEPEMKMLFGDSDEAVEFLTHAIEKLKAIQGSCKLYPMVQGASDRSNTGEQGSTHETRY